MVQIKAVHEMVKEISPYYAAKERDGKPESEHKLVYESNSEGLEAVYFFMLDLIESFGLQPEKIVDNFSSSPGSGYFAEMGQRSSIMQQQGAKILVDINVVLKSVLNIIYDLKEFRIRLQSYDDLKNSKTKEAAILSLKQVWMDKVDINKGNSSIKAMSLGQAGFQTLINAFLAIKTTEEAKKLDLNDLVKRILIPRIAEFNSWLEHSEMELRKRYELEKTYLKSQVSSLKLYSRWAKPYLRAAAQLETKDFGNNPALVKVFNTLLLELTLLGKQELKVKEAALEGALPKDFTKDGFLKTLKRKYYGCLLVDFKFRGIPQRAPGSQHFNFGGKSEVVFRAYALNEDELKKLKQELDKSDVSNALSLVDGTTDESLAQLQEEIDFFLEEKSADDKNSSSDSSNPFFALFGIYDKSSGKQKPKNEKEKDIIVKKDNWVEKNNLRPLTIERIKDLSYNIFDVYKKAHGMPSFT